MAEQSNFKVQAHALIDDLPDTADWKELANEITLVQDIEEALIDSDNGQLIDNEEVRRQYEGGE